MTHYRRFSVPNASVINLDWRVLLFALGLTLLTGIIFGLAPAWVASGTDLNESLRESGANSAAESGRRRLRNGLVISEIALALVLLTGAGLAGADISGTDAGGSGDRPDQRGDHGDRSTPIQVFCARQSDAVLPSIVAAACRICRALKRRESSSPVPQFSSSPKARRQRFRDRNRRRASMSFRPDDFSAMGIGLGGGTRVYAKRRRRRNACRGDQRGSGASLLAELESHRTPSLDSGASLLGEKRRLCAVT